jgi:hypothetical protein
MVNRCRMDRVPPVPVGEVFLENSQIALERRGYARRGDEEIRRGPLKSIPPEAAPAVRSILKMGRAAIGIIVGPTPSH